MTSRIKICSPGVMEGRRILRFVLFFLLTQATVPLAYSQAGAAQLALKPVDLKLLVLTGSGTEPSFTAIQSFLNAIGIPHDDVVLAPVGGTAAPLPPLNDSTKGFYQGVILTSGNLAVCNATSVCASALSDAGWAALDSYTASYGVRTLSYYTFPNPRYGLTYVNAVGTTSAPGTLAFAPAASAIFPYLNLTHTFTVTNSYVYLATPVAAAGETTTPILSMNGSTVAALHKTADGREYLALTFDNNLNLLHSLALSYGLINWVTKGVYLGSRQIYFTPQVDDLFLANELYDVVTPGCKPGGFLIDPTSDLSSQCPNDQIGADDLTALAAWQDKLQVSPQTKNFQITMGFNGVGAVDPDTMAIDTTDDLVNAVIANGKKFIWISHTYNHFNLDCYDPVPNSGVCRPATAAESATEIDVNTAVANALGLTIDRSSMITPEISGLNNPAFIQTAVQRGIRYLIIDSSTLALNPPPPNTGLRNLIDSSVLMVPRRPTSIFYNTESAYPGEAGSLPDEYNYFYGPQGLFRIGGPTGTPFFATNQTYAQIINSESDSLLMDLLKFKADPSMFHQSNLIRYDGVNSLFTDLISATLTKFTAMSNLPVTSLPQSTIGALYQDRMDYNASGVKATWYPGTPASISVSASHAAKITITGFCSTGCGSYGGQTFQKVQVQPAQPVTVLPTTPSL